MRKFVLAALVAGTVASPAFAQSSDRPFSGFRVEGLVGYDSVGVTGEDDVDDIGGDDSIEGATYGVGIGFDVDTGGLVIGGEAELTDSTGEFDESDGTLSATLDTGRDIYVGGRLGFKAGDRTLIYGKAGYTNLKLEGEVTDGTTVITGDDEIDGYRLGAGAEMLFGTNTYGKLEYRYSNYGNGTFDDEDYGFDLDRHQIVAGIGIRF